MLMQTRHSIRAIARHIGRASRTVSRELARHVAKSDQRYDARLAGQRARLARHRPRRPPKLHPGGELFSLMVYLLRKYWSPQQIARTLRGMFPDCFSRQVSLEAIYNALYVMPRGTLKNELYSSTPPKCKKASLSYSKAQL